MNRIRNFNKSASQRGYSLIELMISLGIGLFLLVGIAVIFLSNRATFITQGQLATLQNKEIMAMNIIGNVVQSAGYYINPHTQATIVALSAQTVTAPLAVNFAGGQAVFGGAVTGSDSIAVRAYQNNSLGAMDCTGNASRTDLVSSTFSVDTTNKNLQCSINGADSQILVSGVSSMVLLYGVDVSATGSTTQYVTAENVKDWSKVMSVRVTLNFVNPMASQAGQPATLAFTKVIGIMAQL